MTTTELLFGLRARVARRPYIVWGLGLAALKFAIDTAIVYGFTRRTWSPIGYVVPSAVLRSEGLGNVPAAMHIVLVLAALPFLWVGLTMSVRRAADAGISPWLGTLFLVPGVNYLIILLLSVLPTKSEVRWQAPAARGWPYRAAPVDPEAPSASQAPLPSGVRAGTTARRCGTASAGSDRASA